MVEVTVPMNQSIDGEKTKEQIHSGLIKANLLKENDILDVFYTEFIKYAYDIYDLKRKIKIAKEKATEDELLTEEEIEIDELFRV